MGGALVPVRLTQAWAVLAIVLCSWSIHKDGGWGGILSFGFLLALIIGLFAYRSYSGGKSGSGDEETADLVRRFKGLNVPREPVGAQPAQ